MSKALDAMLIRVAAAPVHSGMFQRLARMSDTVARGEVFETYAGGKKFSELPKEAQSALRAWWSSGKEGASPVPVDSKEQSKEAAKDKDADKDRKKRKQLVEGKRAGQNMLQRRVSALKEGLSDFKKNAINDRAEAMKAKDEAAGKKPQSDEAYQFAATRESGRAMIGKVKKAGADMYKDMKAEMQKDGVPGAIASPLAFIEATTGILQLPSPIQLALTAAGQAWVNAVPGIGVVEAALMPKIAAATARTVGRIKRGDVKGVRSSAAATLASAGKGAAKAGAAAKSKAAKAAASVAKGKEGRAADRVSRKGTKYNPEARTARKGA